MLHLGAGEAVSLLYPADDDPAGKAVREHVAQLRADIERVASERDTWRETCAALRAQESRVSGLLADAGDVSTIPVEGVGALARQRDGALRSLRSAIGELREARDEVERLRGLLGSIEDYIHRDPPGQVAAWARERHAALGTTAAQTKKSTGTP